MKIPTDVGDQPQEEGENAGQPQPQVSDQAQRKSEKQTKHNCKSEKQKGQLQVWQKTGSEILNRLAGGESFGGVIDDDEEEEDEKSNVVKQEMEIEIKFDD